MNFKRYVEASDTWVDSHYIKGTDTDTITTLPATIYPLAQTATLGLKGNTVQNGTPTPDNPIMPQSTGERTANLFDYKIAYASYLQNDGTVQAYAQQLAAVQNSLSNYLGQTITIRIYCDTVQATRLLIIATENGVQKESNSIYRGKSGYMTLTITPQQSTDKWSITYGTTGGNETLSKFMINTGSTAKPYEPHGYKIPISINNVVTDIYIGDNPLRKSLDGTAYDTLAADGTLTRRVDSDGSVLPTPIVTQVTMPTFTTTPGANTLDVLTTVPPSEVTATFNGWHPVSSAHERDNGAWT